MAIHAAVEGDKGGSTRPHQVVPLKVCQRLAPTKAAIGKTMREIGTVARSGSKELITSILDEFGFDPFMSHSIGGSG